MKDQMESDLKIIDCKASTEELAKTITVDEDDAREQRELAELLGETVEEEVVEDVQIATYPLGYTYELKRPVTVNNEKITSVSFDKELEGRHIAKLPMDMQAWKWSHYLSLVGACTDLHSSVLLRIQTCDLPKLVEVATSFFANGPENG